MCDSIFIFMKNNFVKFCFVILITIFCYHKNSAQTIGDPTLGLPGNPISIGFCYVPSNPGNYQSQFTFAGFPSNVQFSLEISGSNGIFDANTKTLVGPTSFASSPAVFNFTIPPGIASDTYRLRVKSNTATPVYSGNTTFVAAYYMPYAKNFTLNGNITSTGFCLNGSVTLEIDPATPTQPSPKGITGIVYQWTKDGVVIPNASGEKLTVNASGVYQCRINYGVCAPAGAITQSQAVQVSVANGPGSFNITSSIDPTTILCPQNPTTLSTTPGFSYQWYYNSAPLANATSNSIKAYLTGSYYVKVNPGSSCEVTTNSIQITSKDFDSTINSSAISDSYSIAEGTSLDLVAEAQNAVNPSFVWFEPNNAIAISNTNTISLINKPKESKPLKTGLYTLKVTNNDPTCSYTKTYKFNIKSGVESIAVPNIISPNDQNGENDFWILPKEYKGTDIEVIILDAYGKEVFKTFNYQDNWPKEPIEFKTVNPIFYYIISKDGSPLKKGSLTVLK